MGVRLARCRLGISWRVRLTMATPLGHSGRMRARLLIGGVLALLCAALAVFAVAHGDAPPRLDAEMVARLDQQGIFVVLDESATRAREEDARSLASRYEPSEQNPERRVVAVSLARVTDSAGNDFGDELVWVGVVENVVWRCFGGGCTEDGEPTATEVALVDPENLAGISATVF